MKTSFGRFGSFFFVGVGIISNLINKVIVLQFICTQMQSLKVFRFHPSFMIFNSKLYFMSSQAYPKILLIRHGKSSYNQKCDQHGKGLELDWSRPLVDDEFCEKGPYNICEMDSALAPKGVEQCQQLSKNLRDHPFDLILVSPMLRTLQTCQLVFGNRNIPVKVEPLLAQAYRYSCDLVPPGKTQKKHEMFPKFDFSDDYEPQYFYHFSADKLNFINKHFGWNNISDPFIKCKEIIKLIRFHRLIEGDNQLRQRSKIFKEKLDQLIKKGGYQNVCLISHYHTMSCLLAKSFGPDGQILQSIDVQNCQPFEEPVQKFMEIM